MLPVMFKNSWFPTVFEDFLNNDFMPRANTTAPAVNVREDEKAYTMEVAAPGIKKEFCRVPVQPRKADSPMDVTLSGMVTEVRPSHPENASLPKEVTSSPIMMVFRVVRPLNQL